MKITAISFLVVLLCTSCFTGGTAPARNTPPQSRILQPTNSGLIIGTLKIPPRAVGARSGSQFMRDVENLSFEEREAQIFSEASRGNIPDFMRQFITINSQFADADGIMHTVQYQVMPDYLCLGSDEDFCRVPTGPITAQRLADLFGAILPTRQLVDDIHKHATIKLEPVTYYPVANQNERVSKFVKHNAAIDSLMDKAGGKTGQLISGIKKDVVLSKRIADPNRPHHVVIYGWHRLDGKAIQALTNIHIDWYVDYSHGIRFLNDQFLLDGKICRMSEILKDPILYKVLSDEDGAMRQPHY